MRVTEAHIEARKNQILDAAWECFAQLGYHQTTMATIAAAANLSAGSLYLYFDNKEALMTAINERSREISREIVTQARGTAGAPLAALRTVGTRMLAAFRDARFAEAARVNIELWPEILRNDALATDLKVDLDFWKETVTQLLTEAQETGDLQADVDARSVALLVISAFEGLRHYRLVDSDFNEQVLLEAFRPLVKGDVRPFGSDDLESLKEPPGPPLGMPARDSSVRGSDEP